MGIKAMSRWAVVMAHGRPKQGKSEAIEVVNPARLHSAMLLRG
jgi:hypothetical protein